MVLCVRVGFSFGDYCLDLDKPERDQEVQQFGIWLFLNVLCLAQQRIAGNLRKKLFVFGNVRELLQLKDEILFGSRLIAQMTSVCSEDKRGGFRCENLLLMKLVSQPAFLSTFRCCDWMRAQEAVQVKYETSATEDNNPNRCLNCHLAWKLVECRSK